MTPCTDRIATTDLIRAGPITQTHIIHIMKSILALSLAVAALTLSSCAHKQTQNTPPPIDMGHRSGK